MQKYVHKAIAKIAKEMAAAQYEYMASSNNAFYKDFPDQKVYVELMWRYFIRTARESLADLLGQEKYPSSMKEEIFDILTKDASLRPAAPARQSYTSAS